MPLTTRDKEFLERLRGLIDEKELRVELRDEISPRMVLRQNYGDRIERAFGVTRQGVRWRFGHVFNDLYVNALVTVLLVESAFGTGLRQDAMTIARHRADLAREARKQGLATFARRQNGEKTPKEGGRG